MLVRKRDKERGEIIRKAIKEKMKKMKIEIIEVRKK